MKHDSEGFFRHSTSMAPLDAYMLDHMHGNKLSPSVLHNTPITSSKKRVLDDVRSNPWTTMEQCAARIDQSPKALNKVFNDFVGLGYLNKSAGSPNEYHITLAGGEAANRTEIDHAQRHADIEAMRGPYEVYKPPVSQYLRPGSDQAIHIKSRGL